MPPQPSGRLSTTGFLISRRSQLFQRQFCGIQKLQCAQRRGSESAKIWALLRAWLLLGRRTRLAAACRAERGSRIGLRTMRKYIAITPARDEEKLLPGLIASMTSQTCRPGRWIVIDDGSTDSTAQIVTDAAKTWPWIELHRLSHRRERTAGGESVVMQFLPRNEIERYDFILRADADVSFDSDFAALLIGEFENDPGLGIGGPVLLEPFGSGWRELSGPGFHVPGGLKMYSVACFAAICGLTSGLGWDTIDLMSAQMRGYRTRKFAHIRALHHRPQGAASGMCATVWRKATQPSIPGLHRCGC